MPVQYCASWTGFSAKCILGLKWCIFSLLQLPRGNMHLYYKWDWIKEVGNVGCKGWKVCGRDENVYGPSWLMTFMMKSVFSSSAGCGLPSGSLSLSLSHWQHRGDFPSVLFHWFSWHLSCHSTYSEKMTDAREWGYTDGADGGWWSSL